jgi:tetratricopeptide (TPR) repeat protein
VGQAHFARGVLLYRQKDFSRAEAEFVAAQSARLTEVPQADVTAWRALSAVSGTACSASLDILESLYRTASDQFPKAEAAAMVIDCRLKQASNLDQYLAVEKQYAERLDPARRRDLRNHIADAYANQGVAAEDGKDPMAAATAYEQALRWNPSNAKARFNLGAIYIEDKRFDQAEEQYRALVEADANDYEAHYWLGASILAQHPPPERVATACEILRHALSINDPDKRAQFNKVFTAARCLR